MSLGLGSTLYSKGEISQRGGVLRTHWCGTEAPPDIAGWNGREWRRELFLTRDSGLLAGGWSLSTPSAGILSIGHHPGPSFPPQSRQRGLSPSHHRDLLVIRFCGLTMVVIILHLLTAFDSPLSSHRNPFPGFWHCSPAFQIAPPFHHPPPPKHTLWAFFPLPFVCVLVHQRITSQLALRSQGPRDSLTSVLGRHLQDCAPGGPAGPETVELVSLCWDLLPGVTVWHRCSDSWESPGSHPVLFRGADGQK